MVSPLSAAQAMSRTGYFVSPWPGEDGGPARLQAPHGTPGLQLREGEHLDCVTRNTMLSTMTVLGAPGEVYLLSHSALRAHIGLTTTACVELIDPLNLKTLLRSPRLAGGPMWPGGMAIHNNGDLYVVYGRYLHRLNRQCQLLGSLQLPLNQPYNSFVILDNGLLVCKNLSDSHHAGLCVINAQTLKLVGPPIDCPEPSIARLSASGNTLYVVGVRSIMRYHWDEHNQRLQRDTAWHFDYIGASQQSYGWDAVVDGRNAWFMDNGKHRYRYRMIGAGVSPTANRLIRVSLSNSSDHQSLIISGLPGGSITNPPLVDLKRQIVLGYDAANRHLQAWRFNHASNTLTALWHRSAFGCASHMLLYPDSGEVICNDYRRHAEEVVVLDIENGRELGRVRTGGLTQGVVFPSSGWGRDLYWSSMGRLARIYVR
jgi:hypothetical protein